MSSSALGTKPKTITGGCLCAALRYTITFPDSHDFVSSAVTCQCTQCRKQSGALFVAFHRVPWPLQWSSAATPTLREYSITPAAMRGFCTQCSSWLYYRSEGQDSASICIGTVDQEVLIGKKGERDGFGRALANGLGGHEWCENEIPGVTDDVPLLRRGERNQGSQEESAAVKSKL
ncbi:glutathione-dependent formaldehyde-activating enzyme [Colletotrichum tofieldiae]|uniref:Glutathione-dependent formaldehyde-activating enzyme n=1 Tax=Colletotrichum tofieldiae TaxID=708197 RepID=A0A166SPR2_9PEZI|nr:glutathione-dependent formaldehyde-activating enzyme [Colletotrichum tofieldiae]GKT54599.1 glutathione-dependent formaldehyde-activating enzyme [Colletotrichum tofieldiae]GKT76111.1 glutathione-dependent formaldehyde-activating enzyme [Colletotrichum tofieldiae]